jgi:hypothetical protein
MISRVLICLLLVSASLASTKGSFPFTKCDNLDNSYISIEALDITPVDPARGDKIDIVVSVKGTASSAVLVDLVTINVLYKNVSVKKGALPVSQAFPYGQTVPVNYIYSLPKLILSGGYTITAKALAGTLEVGCITFELNLS